MPVGPGPAGEAGQERQAALAAGLAAVRERIAAACAAAGRDPGDVTLIAVTKTYPASDVRALRDLGLREFGENRDQEAGPKADACAGLGITWHFVGQVQTRKAASVARYADVVHSLDRARLARHLGTAARAAGRELTCLVQVSIDGDPERGGVPPAGVAEVAEAIESEGGLALGGVMAVAPIGMPPSAAFDILRRCSDTVRAVRPRASVISGGMSGDMEDAIAGGATHLRIGTALLGDRKPPVR
ncbi:MAG TPA: YggS family pyridoxal phosphate-dependent enzyme [Trebonia sp.]|nr:YggS family pyridoxal phosphate-dependent enzyme [Trebonia sp.]